MEKKENLNHNGIKNLLDDLILTVQDNKENFGEGFDDIIANLDSLKKQIDSSDFSMEDIKDSLNSLKQKVDTNNLSDFKTELSELIENLNKIEKQKKKEVEQIAFNAKQQLNKLPFDPNNPEALQKQAEIGRKEAAERIGNLTDKIAESNIPLFSSVAKSLKSA